MDQHVQWLRRQVVHGVILRTLALWLLISGAIAIIGVVATDAGWAQIVGVALLAGQLVALFALGVALTLNPLHYRFARDFADSPPEFVRDRSPALTRDPATLVDMAGLGMHPTSTVVQADDDPEAETNPAFDLFQNQTGMITAAVGRTTGSLSLVTGLDDGRLLHTSSMLVPPCADLVVNVVDTDDPRRMHALHRNAVMELMRHGCEPIESPGEVYLEALRREAGAYAQLGPFVTPFLRLDHRARTPLTVAVDAEEVLERTLRDVRPGPASRVPIEVADVQQYIAAS